MSLPQHGKEDVEISIASATPVDKRSTELDFGTLEKGQDAPLSEQPEQLKRGLKSRHLQMIAVRDKTLTGYRRMLTAQIGGTIGTGLFIGSGGALAKAGPVGALIAYIWVGTLVYSVMLSLGEMATFMPIAGAFTSYASRFVDRALAFAMGWLYWFSWAITFALELTAIGIIIEYWTDKVPDGVFIAIFWVIITLINFLPVKFYGEIEFWAASIKVITVIGFLIFGICINAGAGSQGYIGFKYWVEPGAFNGYLVGTDATAKFVGFWAVLIQAGFAYQGTELVGIAVAEVENPRVNVPAAIKKTFYRIIVFFVGVVFFIGILIPSDTPDLLNDASDATASPFVIAANLAGVKVLPDIINAVLLTVVLSAANSNVYSGSRILVGLANDHFAPSMVGRTNKHGVPYVAVSITSAFGLLAFLNLSNSGGTVFNWFVNISGVAGFISWCSISFSHICFMRALRAQGISRDTLPFKAPFQPWFSYYGCAFMVLITVTQGFTCFMPWSTADFFVNYLSLILFVVLYVGYKVIYRTKFVSPLAVDFQTGRRVYEDEHATAEKETRSSIWKRLGNVVA